MNKNIITFLVLLCSSVLLFAQQKKEEANKKIAYGGKASLHGGLYSGGTISKMMFDSLIGLQLVGIDSNYQLRPIGAFNFTYAERGVYEDSMGRLKIMTDYYSTSSASDRLDSAWLNLMLPRVKAGDTAIFNNIIAIYDDSIKNFFFAEPFKLIITDEKETKSN